MGDNKQIDVIATCTEYSQLYHTVYCQVLPKCGSHLAATKYLHFIATWSAMRRGWSPASQIRSTNNDKDSPTMLLLA